MLESRPNSLEQLRNNIEYVLSDNFASMKPHSLYEPIRYMLEGGGKRLRPVLTALAADIAGGQYEYQSALQAGAAVELLHNFTLVHDDIMDSSDMRRGRQTVHRRWNDAAAILSGDAMLGSAYRLLLHSSSKSSRFNKIIECFTNGLIGVCEGQALDIDFQRESRVSMLQYITMIELKTAKLIETAVEIGGLLGGGSSEQITALQMFARFLGIAFQIQDDVLDLIGDEKEFGKPIGNDILEGKKTYLIVRASEIVLNDNDKLVLDKFYKNQGLPPNDIPIIIEMFKRLEIVQDAQKSIEHYAMKAAEFLHVFNESPAKTALLSINNQLIERRI